MKKYIWCLHCERTYLKEAEHDKYECAYPGCDGHIGDLWEWERIKEHHPEYPATPKRGQVYPM